MDAGELLIHGVEDAEAGRAVKTDVDVEVVFFAQPHGAVNRLNFFLVDGEEIGSGPEAIIHRQTDPVEAPIANPAKIVLGEHPIVAILESISSNRDRWRSTREDWRIEAQPGSFWASYASLRLFTGRACLR